MVDVLGQWAAQAHHGCQYHGYGERKGEFPNDYELFLDQPNAFQASVYFASVEEAEEAAKAFPKSLRLRVGRWVREGVVGGAVHFNVKFVPNAAMGKANEAGIARLAKFRAKAGPLAWKAQCVNSYQSEEAFDAGFAAAMKEGA